MRGALAATALTLAVWVAPPAAADPAAADPTIVMGVRADAPPFAWRDRTSGGYLGFLVDICVDAVQRADFGLARKVAVSAADRLAFFEGGRKDIDLLCDPTTITLERLGQFARVGLDFSPIVFVANGSYVENPDAASGVIDKAAGAASECLASPPPRAAAQEAAPPTAASQSPAPVRLAAGFVLGATSGDVLRSALRAGALPLRPGETVCPVEKASHWETARAFCAGELRYYFGDQDILRSTLAIEAAARPEGCAVPKEPLRPLSYEPYALVVSDRLPGFRAAFVKALYEVFHTGTAEDRFPGAFEDRPMSPYLRTLFRINSIPAGASAATDRPLDGGVVAGAAASDTTVDGAGGDR